MPSSPGYKRDYKKEREVRIAKEGNEPNILRKQARRDMEKAGKVKKGQDVDHVTPISKGGKNGAANLKAVSPAKNRSYARNPDGSIK